VVSRDDHTLVGIVALADLVESETDDSKTAQTLLEISAPLPVGQARTTLQLISKESKVPLVELFCLVSGALKRAD